MSTKHTYNSRNPSKTINTLNVYLPGYLRLKFKNFVSLDLPNLSGEMNATLIYNIYYGALFQQLKSYGITQKDEKDIRQKMANQFVMNFSKDDAIQLTQGKQDKLKRAENEKGMKVRPRYKAAISEQEKKKKQMTQVKLKRNIEMTVKMEDNQKMIKFTLRKNFKVHLKSSAFWSPFQIIDSILEITIQTLKIKTKNFDLEIQINLMDTKSGSSKVSYSEQKKFGQYGLVLSGLQAIYSNKKLVVGNPEVFDEKAKQGEDKTRLFENKLEIQTAKRFKQEYDMVMGNDLYESKRAWYKKEYKKNKAKYRYILSGGLMKDQEETAELILEQHGRPSFVEDTQENIQQTFNSTTKIDIIPKGTTDIKQPNPDPNSPAKTKTVPPKQDSKKSQKPQACKYASFKIPLYKLPFTSMATIFVPLWLLAVLNLGVFFQEENLGERIASIASLALAFIAFIPTIRQQIPPGPSIVFVQILVYLVAATSLLALGQSIEVHQIEKFVFVQWYNDVWFMISMILNILVFAIVIIMTLVHYTVWQPRYKQKVQTGAKEGKFNRRYWYNRPCEKEFRGIFKQKPINWMDTKDVKDEKACHRVFEVIDQEILDKTQRFNQTGELSKIDVKKSSQQ